MAGLFVRRVGVGPRVVLLHGGAIPGEVCWHAQLPLADRFTLEIVDRAGYGHSAGIGAGAGHATPDTGEAFNETLETFIRAATR